MRRRRERTAGAVSGGVLLALLAGPAAAAEPATASSTTASASPSASGAAAAKGPAADGNSSMVMVLDSSGSMADDDGSGGTRIESARKAVGTVADSLPDGFPAGLRVYGADRAEGCTDTRLAKPVEPLDRAGLKKAVAAVEPKGDTPIGYSLKKAAADLPATPDGALGRRTILLISDGEDNCGAPDPCEVAEELAADGVDLRIDTIGFQVKGTARKQLECVAEAGHGRYYDAPDADDLARELERAGRLSADGYRFRGKRINGADNTADAPTLRTPGQYLDTIGPGETRWYATRLDGGSATDLAVTGVPQPGVAVRYLDGLRLRMRASDGSLCGDDRASFRQSEGAAPLTTSVSRIPGQRRAAACDRAGVFTFELTRRSGRSADQASWPVELRLAAERPLKAGVTPAGPATGYGAAGEDATLPMSDPKEVQGGTGFNDATRLRKGVWRDTLLPAQTRFYRVPVGWGQQLRYDVEFANEPRRGDRTVKSSSVRTEAFAPGRLPLKSSSEFTQRRTYRGAPVKVSAGTVPVAWNNRAETATSVRPVRRDGDFYLAVSLGADAARIAENAAVRVVLRVDVKGEAKAGPAHDARPVKGQDKETASGQAADSGVLPHPALLAGGGALLLAVVGGAGYAVRRRNRNGNVTRGGTW